MLLMVFSRFQSRVPVYAVNSPAGTTVQDFIHFFQIIETGRFAKFDYDDKPTCYPGVKSNMAIYGKVGRCLLESLPSAERGEGFRSQNKMTVSAPLDLSFPILKSAGKDPADSN